MHHFLRREIERRRHRLARALIEGRFPMILVEGDGELPSADLGDDPVAA